MSALHIVNVGKVDRPINQAQIESLAKYAQEHGHAGSLLNAYGVHVIVLANGFIAHDTPPARIVERAAAIAGTPRQDTSTPR